MAARDILFVGAAIIALSASAPAAAQAKPVYGAWGYDPAAMDRSVKPGDDFWSFVNGSWDRNTAIAPDLPAAGPFMTLYLQAENDVRGIVDRLAAAPKRSALVARSVTITAATWIPRRSTGLVRRH